MNFGHFSDLGGAHPNSYTTVFNVGMTNGRPKLLTMGDFFEPNSDYRSRTNGLISKKLEKQGNADWVNDGSLKMLSTNQLNSFIVTKRGMEWIFDPYEVGSYASGSHEVLLSPTDLGTGFKKSWLAK